MKPTDLTLMSLAEKAQPPSSMVDRRPGPARPEPDRGSKPEPVPLLSILGSGPFARSLQVPMVEGAIPQEGAVPQEAAGLLWLEQLALRYLEPGEIIEMAVRPSRWSVLFTSARWLLVCVLLALAAPFLSAQTGLAYNQVAQLILILALARLIYGIAQWFGILYLLTNRRVLSVHGLIRPHAVSTLLTEIRAIHLNRSRPERLLHLGTITIVTDEFSHRWIHLRDSGTIRDKLLRFVSRSH